MRPTPRSTDRATTTRRAWWLYASEISTGLGDGIFWVALISVIADEASFGWLLTLAVVARLTPRALLSIPAGAFVDRSDPRSTLLVVELSRAALMIYLSIAVALGLHVVLVLAAVLVAFVVGVPARPALAAATPYVVGERALATTYATISAIRQLMTFVGPMVGVGVVAIAEPLGFTLNGISFAVSAACIGAIRGVHWPTPSRRRAAIDTLDDDASPGRDGSLGVVRRTEGLSTLIGLIGAMYFVRGAEIVLHVLVVRDVLMANPSAIGYLSGAIGAGALLATPLARRAARTASVTRTIIISVVLTAVPSAVLALAGNVPVAALLVVPVGVGMVLFEVISVITVQRVVPRTAYGRVFGAVNSASNAGKLAGAISMPAIAALWTVEGSLLALAMALLSLGLGSIATLRRLERIADVERDRLAPVVDALAGLAIFDHTPRTSLEQVAELLTEERVPAGATLIVEGDVADDLFVARSGSFDVTVGARRVNTMGADDWFGEIGLVEGLPRTASVTATTDAVVWRIPGDVFLETLATSSQPSEALVAGIADRLAATRGDR